MKVTRVPQLFECTACSFSCMSVARVGPGRAGQDHTRVENAKRYGGAQHLRLPRVTHSMALVLQVDP